MHPNLDPDFDRMTYRHARNASCRSVARGESDLWNLVIYVAFLDAGLIQGEMGTTPAKPRKSSTDVERQRALSWLLRDTQDFYFVCELAGQDPVYIRSAVRRAVKQKRV